jgi:hypothetical protein
MVGTAAASGKFFFIFLYYTNVYFKSTPSQCVETTMAATASVAQDGNTSRTAGVFFFCFFYYTNVFFRPTQCIETAMAAAAVAGARDPMRFESLLISRPLPLQRGRKKNISCVLRTNSFFNS